MFGLKIKLNFKLQAIVVVSSMIMRRSISTGVHIVGEEICGEIEA